MSDLDTIEGRVRDQTHTFQNIRPLHPDVNAMCSRCGLALPHGPILSLGPGGLPPCGEPPPRQDV